MNELPTYQNLILGDKVCRKRKKTETEGKGKGITEPAKEKSGGVTWQVR